MFSIELGFKAMIMKHGGVSKGHNLSELFLKIWPWTQNVIIQGVGLERKSFTNELSQMSEAFTKWRYIYEYEEVAGSIGFLDKLARTTQRALSDIVGT